MAILKAGNTEVEICFHHYQSCGCTEYSFEPRVNGVPLINPLANQPFCSGGKYIAYTVWQEENLLPFFQKLVLERKDTSYRKLPTSCKYFCPIFFLSLIDKRVTKAITLS